MTDDGTRRSLPLDGLRVIECCGIWSGPYFGQLLADLGAEVVKVEWTERYDAYRTRGVERLRKSIPEQYRIELSRSFHSVNRNKLGFGVNFKSPAGIELTQQLIRVSDIVVDNYSSGVMDRLGLGFSALSEINPDITTVSLSGFGDGSRLADARAYGLVLSALGGVEYLIEDEGEFMGSPSFVVSDPNAAVFGAIAAMAGVLRARSGAGGMHVEVSQLEAMMALAEGLPDRQVVSPSGAPVLSLEDGFVSEYYDEPIRQGVDHPIAGKESLVGSAWRRNGRRAPIRKLSPRIGESNYYLLHQVLGYSVDEIEQFERDGVIGPAMPIGEV